MMTNKKPKKSKWLCSTNGIAGYLIRPNGNKIAGICEHSGDGEPVQCKANENFACEHKVLNDE